MILSARLNALNKLIEKADLLRSSIVEEVKFVSKARPLQFEHVFIVHGHDEAARVKAARFLEKFGLKPIILNEQASFGMTIIEKIEKYSDVGFGIILYTPCDTGGKKATVPVLRDRARQNVVFEHGYLIGKIGRQNVCALVKDNLEIPNDISGVVYITMDDADAWHFKVAKELKNAGYDIDMNKL
ncbi:MAG: nucleotide-binding protein [Ferruginibacter sp.]